MATDTSASASTSAAFARGHSRGWRL
jgi:hypothetical protein